MELVLASTEPSITFPLSPTLHSHISQLGTQTLRGSLSTPTRSPPKTKFRRAEDPAASLPSPIDTDSKQPALSSPALPFIEDFPVSDQSIPEIAKKDTMLSSKYTLNMDFTTMFSANLLPRITLNVSNTLNLKCWLSMWCIKSL